MKTAKLSAIPALLVVIVLFLSGCTATKKVAAPVVEGIWEFVVTGAPQGDVKGDMEISKTGTVYKGFLKMPDGNKTDITGMTITNKILTGKFEFSDMSIDMAGTFEADKYTGTVSSQGYSFPMTANRKK